MHPSLTETSIGSRPKFHRFFGVTFNGILALLTLLFVYSPALQTIRSERHSSGGVLTAEAR